MEKYPLFGERLAFALWWRQGMISPEPEKQFAELLGVTGGAVSQWRERDEPVDYKKCKQIAELCEVPVDWLQDEEAGQAPPLFARFRNALREWKRKQAESPAEPPKLRMRRVSPATEGADRARKGGAKGK